MSGAAKPKATPADAQNEIDQIMNDIADLQKELESAHAVQNKSAPVTAAAHQVDATSTVSSSPGLTAVTAVEEAGKAGGQDEGQSEEDALKEFRASAGDSEASLESTLADLGEESTGGGTSLLDQVLSGEPETPEEEIAAQTEEPVQEEPVQEVSEAPEEPVLEAEEEPVHEGVAPEETVMKEEELMTDPDMESDTDPQSSASDGMLTLQLQGTMTLKLKFEADGHEVTVGFSDGCLKVQLADGTEFKVPVSKRTEAQGSRGKKVRPLRRVS